MGDAVQLVVGGWGSSLFTVGFALSSLLLQMASPIDATYASILKC